jgi:methyl-accepting chemotaxis protein
MKPKIIENVIHTKERNDMPSYNETRDLLSLVASRTFGAVFIGMLLYTFVEYLIERPYDWSGFLTHHILHVVVIGVAVWIVSTILIRHLVIKPVDHVFLHLRRVASGRLDYLDIEVGSTQFNGVVGSVNELVARLRRTPEDDSVSRALDHIRKLRAALKEQMKETDEDAVTIMRLVTKLEGELLEVMQEHPVKLTKLSGSFPP